MQVPRHLLSVWRHGLLPLVEDQWGIPESRMHSHLYTLLHLIFVFAKLNPEIG